MSKSTTANPFARIRAAVEEVRSSADYRFENAHREAPESLVIQRTTRGAGYFEKGKVRHLVRPEQAMLFSHSEPSAYGFPPEASEPYAFQFICFSAGSLRPLFDRLRSEHGPVLKMPDKSESATLFQEIMTCYQAHRFRDRLEECDLLHRLLLGLYRDQIETSEDPIQFGFHAIHSHFRANVNLKTIAQDCGVSREHFIRQFTLRYGESPGAMLRRFRLEHARAMLLSTRLSVQDVGLASGFSSSNAFCRAYRSAYGRSPSETRSG